MLPNVRHQPQLNVGISTVEFFNVNLMLQLSNPFTKRTTQTEITIVFVVQIVLIQARNNKLTIN